MIAAQPKQAEFYERTPSLAVGVDNGHGLLKVALDADSRQMKVRCPSKFKEVPLAKLFNWVMGLVSGSGSKVVALQTSTDAPALQPSKAETLDFEADFASQFELDMEDAA